jgi:hypothetical protein
MPTVPDIFDWELMMKRFSDCTPGTATRGSQPASAVISSIPSLAAATASLLRTRRARVMPHSRRRTAITGKL